MLTASLVILDSPDNVIMTIAQLVINLSDDQQECSLGVGYLLQAVPETYTSGIGRSFFIWKVQYYERLQSSLFKS